MIRDQQIDKLSELFIDVAKGLILAGVAVPLLTNHDIITFAGSMVGAIFSTYFSIKILQLKGK